MAISIGMSTDFHRLTKIASCAPGLKDVSWEEESEIEM
jgi:hypothetical protein